MTGVPPEKTGPRGPPLTHSSAARRRHARRPGGWCVRRQSHTIYIAAARRVARCRMDTLGFTSAFSWNGCRDYSPVLALCATLRCAGGERWAPYVQIPFYQTYLPAACSLIISAKPAASGPRLQIVLRQLTLCRIQLALQHLHVLGAKLALRCKLC